MNLIVVPVANVDRAEFHRDLLGLVPQATAFDVGTSGNHGDIVATRGPRLSR